MRSILCNIISGVSLLLVVATCSPANAFNSSDADDQSGDQSMDQQQKNCGNSSKPSVVTNGAMSISRPTDQTKAFGPAPSDMKLIGYWVGNMQYKVGQSADGLYVVNSHGMAAPLPAGTALDTIMIPFDNPFVQGIMHAQPVASQETQIRSDKNGGMGHYISNPGVLKPTFMATRTMIVDGKPMVVGGPVICEIVQDRVPPVAQVPQMTAPISAHATTQTAAHTQARVMKHKGHPASTAKKKIVKKDVH
jgi:hypothetical protein